MSETFPQDFGRYQLTSRLALGGMAELFLAEVAGAHGFAKTVVIKRILPHLAANEEFNAMFITEAKITAELAHPKIAQTLELGTQGEQLFIVMEYIDGLDVLALLRECAHRRVRVPEEITVYIMKEVLDALDFAHKLHSKAGKHFGIVHRDVSPSNVLLSKRGDVKLIDFGIAHAAQGNTKTKAGTLKGKYGYMSPEQVLAQEVTPKSDIFAAGVVMAEMLMGRRLFAAANELDVLLMVRDVDLSRLEKFGDHIQMDLANLLRWALRKDPGDRYKDARAFGAALDEWLFDQRHRIGSSELADIVNSLYEDASARRKKSLEELDAAGPSDAPKVSSGTEALPPNDAVDPIGLAPSVGQRDGVPAGLGERPVSDEPSSIIEVTMNKEEPVESELMALAGEREPEPGPSLGDGLDMDLAKPEVPLLKKRGRRLDTANPTPAAEPPNDDILNFELAPADSKNVDIPASEDDIDIEEDEDNDEIDIDEDAEDQVGGIDLSFAAPATVREESGSFEIDFAAMEDEAQAEEQLKSQAEEQLKSQAEEQLKSQAEEQLKSQAEEQLKSQAKPKKRKTSPPRKTPSYDSISAAVASVSPLAPDPASIDFDDSRVAGDGNDAGRFGGELEKSDPPKPPSIKPGTAEPESTGSLQDRSALAALYETTAARQSGKISLKHAGVCKEIFFKRGVPEFVSSTSASELFGAYLVRTEVVSSGELDMALAVMPHFGGKLGDTLVGLGLMKPLEVFRHLTRQVRSKLIEVCTWTKGQYEWYPGALCPKQAFPLDLDPLEVYGAAALAMSKASLDAFFEIHKDRKFAAARSSIVVPELFQVAGIRKYQEAFDGTRSVIEVLKNLDAVPGNESVRNRQVVYLLVNTNLVAESMK